MNIFLENYLGKSSAGGKSSLPKKLFSCFIREKLVDIGKLKFFNINTFFGNFKKLFSKSTELNLR